LPRECRDRPESGRNRQSKKVVSSWENATSPEKKEKEGKVGKGLKKFRSLSAWGSGGEEEGWGGGFPKGR